MYSPVHMQMHIYVSYIYYIDTPLRKQDKAAPRVSWNSVGILEMNDRK